MNVFLKFNNKKHESDYYSNLDTYTSHMMITHTVLAVAALPIVPVNLILLKVQHPESFPLLYPNAVQWGIFYAVLLILGLLARKYRNQLEKHKKVARWVLDLFYTGLCCYLVVFLWHTMQGGGDPAVEYLAGFWHCLVCVTTLNIISRWWLKIAAFLVVILRLTVGSYLKDNQTVFLTVTIEIIIFLFFSTYLQERAEKRRFIEKYKLQMETLALKEILDQTTEKIIICDLEERVQFRKSTHGKQNWWNENHGLIENLKQLRVEQQKNFFEENVNTSGVAEDHEECQFEDFAAVMKKLIQSVKQKQPGFLDQGGNQMQNLMIAHAKISNRITSVSQMLEIRVMYLIYQDVPSLALIFTDITERHLIVKLQDTNDYKNRLLASVSHELRTPLNASLNFIQAAIEDPQIPIHISEDYLIPSLTSNQLLLHLINDILDFSQMSANKLRLTYETCDVKKTLDYCVNLMKLQASKKGLNLSLAVEVETRDSEFTTDHNRLKQVVLNLLSNAVKFTLKGKIEVKASLAENVDNGRVLCVEVSDTGIGISEEDQKKLFKSFEKIDLGERAFLNSTGVGLGLVIASNLVLMLGPKKKNNSLQVKSEVNRGTTLSFWIVNKEVSHTLTSRVDLSDKPENHDNQMDELGLRGRTQCFDSLTNLHISRPLATRRCSLIPSMTCPTINNLLSLRTTERCHCPAFLVVDDDVFNITALSTILKQLGESCSTAYNGRQAIEKVFERQNKKCCLECKPFKVIFMDYSMPVMDGFETTRKLKEFMSSRVLPLVPIIGCTAFVQEKELKRGIEAGMDGNCIKPLNREKISAILAKLDE